jgi:hypothetical protein
MKTMIDLLLYSRGLIIKQNVTYQKYTSHSNGNQGGVSHLVILLVQEDNYRLLLVAVQQQQQYFLILTRNQNPAQID